MAIKKGSMKVIFLVLIIIVALVLIGILLKVLFSPTPEYSYPEYEADQRQMQIREALNRENKGLYLPSKEIILSTKDIHVFGFGIKNTKQELLKYQVIVESVGSNLIFGSNISDNILYEPKVQELQPAEIEIKPIKITAEEVSGTGLFKVNIIDVTNGEPGELYASEDFLITIKD